MCKQTCIALLFAVFAGACAAQQIPKEKEAAYFRCDGVDAQQARQNLEGAGYKVESEGTAKMHTQYKMLPSGFMSKQGSSLDLATYEAKVDVLEQGGGVDWSAEYRKVNPNPLQVTVGGEESFAPILESQVNDANMKQVLNNLRKAVCGGESYF
jgi:hypothetical protein